MARKPLESFCEPNQTLSIFQRNLEPVVLLNMKFFNAHPLDTNEE